MKCDKVNRGQKQTTNGVRHSFMTSEKHLKAEHLNSPVYFHLVGGDCAGDMQCAGTFRGRATWG